MGAPSKKSSSGGDGAVGLALLTGIGAVVAFGWWRSTGRDIFERWRVESWQPLVDALAERAPLIAGVAGVVLLAGVVGLFVWRRWADARAAEVRSFSRAVDGMRVGRGKQERHARVELRGVGSRRRMVVWWPDGWPGAPTDRERVERAVNEVAGRDVPGVWRRNRVVFPWAFPDVPVDTVHADTDPRVERVTRVLTDTLPGFQRVMVSGDPPSMLSVVYEHGPKARTEAARRRVEDAVGQALTGERWVGEWRPSEDRVVFRPSGAIPSRVVHPGPGAVAGPWVIAYGVSADGEPQTWDLMSAPHSLIAGKTGTGKSVLIRSMIASLLWLPSHPEIVCCDPKRIELAELRKWPGVTRVETSIEGMTALIAAVHTEMDRRYEAIEAAKMAGLPEPEYRPVVLVVDEFVEFHETLKQLATGSRAELPIPIAQCDSIARLGRSAHIHLLVAAQRPDVKYIPGPMRSNTDHRVSLGELDPQGSMMMWGAGGTGTRVAHDDKGQVIKGRATASGPVGPREAQVFVVDGVELPPDPELPSFLDGVNLDTPASRAMGARRAEARKKPPDAELVGNLAARVGRVVPPVLMDIRATDLLGGERVRLDVGNGDTRDVEITAVREEGDGWVAVGWSDGSDEGELSVAEDDVLERL